jgi:hypothetical protein
MLRGMSARQFEEWQIYAELEPWGELRQDLRIAHVVSTLVNLQRDSTKHPEPYPIADFLLRFDDDEKGEPAARKPAKSPEQIRQILQALTLEHNEAAAPVAVPRQRNTTEAGATHGDSIQQPLPLAQMRRFCCLSDSYTTGVLA